MTPPTVSIVLPTYNAAAFLRQSITSALSQSFRDFELLVMDNASTDDTPDVVAQFDDPRIRYVRNPRNFDFSGNIARGFALARGKYVTLLGADDLFTPDFLKRTVTFMHEHPGASMVHTDAIWIDEENRAFGESAAGWPDSSPPREAFINCYRHGFCTSALLMRTDRIVRPDWRIEESWGVGADLPLFLWLCLEGDVGFIHAPLVYYRHHRRNLSTKMFGGANGGLLRLELWGFDLALGWPRGQELDLMRARGQIRRCIAKRNIRMLHLGRIEGLRSSWFTVFLKAVSIAPSVVMMPSTWARFALGLLPRSVIGSLQRWRHARAKRRYADAGPTQLGAHDTAAR
jgi:glycosyltransferase involved in cell wall biosynthesis